MKVAGFAASAAPCLAMLLGVAWPTRAAAQAVVPAPGEGTFVAAWQNVVVHDHVQGDGTRLQTGDIATEALLLLLDYGLAERLALSVSLPYLNKQYVGPRAHDPADVHFDGHDPAHAELLDDGRYHGHWQDWNLGLRWQWRTEPWLLTPFVTLGVPSHDYTYFAHAAPGTRQRRLELGLHFATTFGGAERRWYFAGGYGHSWHERVQDIRLRTSKLNFEFGYHLTDRLSLRLLGIWQKGHNGLDFPDDFPSRDDELWFNHDRTQRIDFLETGLGFAFDFDDRHRVFGQWITSVHAEGGHATHNAVALGLARSF